MERTILVIVLIVALVGVVGLFSSYDFTSPADALPATGMAITELSHGQACGQCAGYAPVCVRVNNRYATFANACEAECAGGRIVRQFACERI